MTCCILVKSPRAGERVKASVTRYLTRELKLAVNEQKSRVVKTNDCEFLGFTFRGTKLRWSDQAFADFKHHVRKLTGRSWGVSMAYRLDRLARYVRGWMNYFGISDYYRPIPEIDCVDPSAHPHVLLETVALGAHQGPQSSGVGDE